MNLVYNTIDNIQVPRNGIFAKLENSVAGAGGDVRYLKTGLDVRYYRELYADWGLIGSLRFKAGNIVGLGQKVNLIDNYFIGGETIRGFETAGIGARDLTKVNYAGGTFTSNESLGSRTFVAGTAEVSAPVPGTPEEFGLYYSLFADAGTAFNVDKSALPPKSATFNYVEDAAIRSSVGVGIMWRSPFGPLRADFGFPVTKGKGDITQIFRFSGGTQF